MKCQRFEQLIALYVEGDLGSRKARKVEAHLSECSSCRRFADGLKQSQAELKAFAQVPIDPQDRESLRQAVMTEILARPGLIQRRRFWLPPEIRWQPVGAVLAVISLAIAAALFLSDREPSEQKHAGGPTLVSPQGPESKTPAQAQLGESRLARAPATSHEAKSARGTSDVAARKHIESSPQVARVNRNHALRNTSGVTASLPPQPSGITNLEPSDVEPPSPVNQTLIKLITNDPNVVIYWIIECRGGKT